MVRRGSGVENGRTFDVWEASERAMRVIAVRTSNLGRRLDKGGWRGRTQGPGIGQRWRKGGEVMIAEAREKGKEEKIMGPFGGGGGEMKRSSGGTVGQQGQGVSEASEPKFHA